MSVLAVVHLAWPVTVTILTIVSGVAALQLAQLAMPGVPPHRRWIRGLAWVVMLACASSMTFGLSMYDPAIPAQRYSYVMAWTTTVFLALLLVAIALVDAWFSLRVIARELDRPHQR
jgi:hypothetical protein